MARLSPIFICFRGPQALNDSFGHVAGSSCLAGDTVHHATLWRRDHPIDLDTFGGTASSASRVNRKDAVIGDYVLSDGTVHGFLWQNASWTDIGSLGGSVTFPAALNDSNVVTGQSDITSDLDPVYGIPHFHGFVWQAGVLTDFGPIFGSNFNYGNAIDAAGGRRRCALDFVESGLCAGPGCAASWPC